MAGVTQTKPRENYRWSDPGTVPSGCAVQATLMLGALLALFLAGILLGSLDESAGPPAAAPAAQLTETVAIPDRDDGRASPVGPGGQWPSA